MVATGKQSERYVVEWCSDMPATEFGDADVDNATYSKRHFESEATAMEFVWTLLDGKGGVPVPEYGVCKLYRQERQLDDDMIQHEGVTRYRWENVATVEDFSANDDRDAPLIWDRCW